MNIANLTVILCNEIFKREAVVICHKRNIIERTYIWYARRNVDQIIHSFIIDLDEMRTSAPTWTTGHYIEEINTYDKMQESVIFRATTNTSDDAVYIAVAVVVASPDAGQRALLLEAWL